MEEVIFGLVCLAISLACSEPFTCSIGGTIIVSNSPEDAGAFFILWLGIVCAVVGTLVISFNIPYLCA